MSATTDLVPAFDMDVVQRVLTSALIAGDEACQRQLPLLLGALEEPYRTIVAESLRLRRERPFFDRNVLGGALARMPLSRTTPDGRVERINAGQTLSLLGEPEIQPGQTEAYLHLLADNVEEKRHQESRDRMADAIQRLSERPDQLANELQRLVADQQRQHGAVDEQFRNELLELIPYMQELETRQRGNAYLGLNSGFEHLNYLCNGLDTGLFVIAAPPGEGKTTWAWQVACQVAQNENVPVIFVSYEQSKSELRAKALARLSHIDYRHILRGRLQADDSCNWPRVLQAAFEYARSASSITIIEGDEHTTINTIRDVAMAQKSRANASRCLIVVDYLQILPLEKDENGRTSSTKEKVDLHVSALRRLARDLKSPVIAISSQNRASYEKAKLDVFKESGIIEYSADVAAVMIRGTEEPGSGADAYRSEELRIVKNRNGERGVVRYRFYAGRMEFVETGRGELPPEE
jgi:replicative DNA helicase